MPTVVEEHLALLEREPDPDPAVTVADRATALDDAIVLHTACYEALERRLGTDGVTEAHRPLVPLFRRWLEGARRLMATVRRLRAQGHPIMPTDELAKAMNAAKPVAESFDHFVALNERIARGEKGTYRPLSEVLDELRD